MTSYEKVFSRSRLKMNDLKEVMVLNDSDLAMLNTERLHSVIGDVRIQNLFSSFVMDDEVQEFSFVLTNSTTEFFDEEFVVELFALGMVISWLRPQVENHEFTAMIIGGKEEKSLNNQYKNVKARLTELEILFQKKIRDRGYLHNGYIEGDEQ